MDLDFEKSASASVRIPSHSPIAFDQIAPLHPHGDASVHASVHASVQVLLVLLAFLLI